MSSDLVSHETFCELPTPWAKFTMHAFTEKATNKEHIAMVLGDVGNGEPALMRIHSECFTGDIMFSQRCDCGAQLQHALQIIAKEGRGLVLYLRQEGRGIGLVNKMRAYQLQEKGRDTLQANIELGFAADARTYDFVKPMLDHFNISSIRMMTNNPLKIRAMESVGIRVAERVPICVNRNETNDKYLETKEKRMGHMLSPTSPGTPPFSPAYDLLGNIDRCNSGDTDDTNRINVRVDTTNVSV